MMCINFSHWSSPCLANIVVTSLIFESTLGRPSFGQRTNATFQETQPSLTSLRYVTHRCQQHLARCAEILISELFVSRRLINENKRVLISSYVWSEFWRGTCKQHDVDDERRVAGRWRCCQIRFQWHVFRFRRVRLQQGVVSKNSTYRE